MAARLNLFLHLHVTVVRRLGNAECLADIINVQRVIFMQLSCSPHFGFFEVDRRTAAKSAPGTELMRGQPEFAPESSGARTGRGPRRYERSIRLMGSSYRSDHR